MKDLEREVRDVMRNNSWMVLSTANEKGVPQSSVVVYVSDGNIFYVRANKDTLKVRNIQKNSQVGIAIPFYKNLLHRLIKKAPPAAIHFRGEAEVLPGDAEEPHDWYKKIVSAELTEEMEKQAVWLKIRPTSKVACYGVGVGFMKMRSPKESMKTVELK